MQRRNEIEVLLAAFVIQRQRLFEHAPHQIGTEGTGEWGLVLSMLEDSFERIQNPARVSLSMSH